MGQPFPSLKAAELLRLLQGKSLGYRVVRQEGSHRRLEAPAHPPLTFAHHGGVEISPGLVRKILTKDVGLTDEEARALLSRKGC